LVRLNPGSLSVTNSAAFEKALGAAIERIKALGVTTVIVDAAARGSQGRLETAWFANRRIPVQADVLSRIVWQLRTRAGVDVAVWLPVPAVRATVGDDAAVVSLFEDLGHNAVADGLVLDQVPTLAGLPLEGPSSAHRWEVRQRRRSLNLSRLPSADALALRAFFAVERVRPNIRLIVLTSTVSDSPSAIADLTLVESPLSADGFHDVVNRLGAAGWLRPDRRYGSGVWVRSEKPPSAADLAANVRLFQRRGGIAFGWEQDDPVADEPKAALTAPAVSAATFPLLRKP
jgi:hypothetical protein